MGAAPFDLERARQKRAEAARLRQIARGLSVLVDRALFLEQAASLETEAAQLEANAASDQL